MLLPLNFSDIFAMTVTITYFKKVATATREPKGPVRQMPDPRHQDCPREFQLKGRARRYLWSHCRTVQPPYDNFTKRREDDRFRRDAKHGSL